MPGTFDKKKLTTTLKTDAVSKVGDQFKEVRKGAAPSKKMIEDVLNEKLPGILLDLEAKILSNFQDSTVDLTKIPLENLKVIVDRYIAMHGPRAWEKGKSSFENQTLRYILKSKGGEFIQKRKHGYYVYTLNEERYSGIDLQKMTKTDFEAYQKQKREKKKN